MEKCTVEGCENKHRAKGYCQKHYIRYKKYGDPLYNKKNIRKNCSVDGCDNIHYSKGYCAKHYARYKKYGDPLYNKDNI